MGTFISVLLIIIAVILFIGIIRICFKPSDSLGELLIDLFLIDWISDVIVAILENIDFD